MRIESIKSEAHSSFAVIVMGVVGFVAASRLYIPFAPVPMTFQALAVLLMGFLYTPTQVLASFSTVFSLAIIGVPVFASPEAGPTVFIGPTAGYLWGMALAAFMMAFVRQHVRLTRFSSYLLLSFLGSSLLYVVGWGWLSFYIGADAALRLGVMPFLFWHLVHTLVAVHAARFYARRFA